MLSDVVWFDGSFRELWGISRSLRDSAPIGDFPDHSVSTGCHCGLDLFQEASIPHFQRMAPYSLRNTARIPPDRACSLNNVTLRPGAKSRCQSFPHQTETPHSFQHSRTPVKEVDATLPSVSTNAVGTVHSFAVYADQRLKRCQPVAFRGILTHTWQCCF